MSSKWVFIITFLLASTGFAASTGAVVKVNGMVCSFCSTSIEKKIKEMPEVSAVDVDLENKRVSLQFAPQKELSEKQITEAITKAGYTVVAIDYQTTSVVSPEKSVEKKK